MERLNPLEAWVDISAPLGPGRLSSSRACRRRSRTLADPRRRAERSHQRRAKARAYISRPSAALEGSRGRCLLYTSDAADDTP
eukprot:7310026-Pyramimonas_sp.AAC.1